MVLATLLVLSSPTNSVSMQAVTVKSGRGSTCNVPIDYSFARITSHFGVRDNPFGPGKKFHHGIDIAADEGVKIRAVSDGHVYFARRSSRGGGLQVNVRAPNGLKFKYSHMSKILVKQGDKVRAGQVLGLVGSTGRSMGPHLHLEVYLNKGKLTSEFLDPRQFICKYRETLWKKHSH